MKPMKGRSVGKGAKQKGKQVVGKQTGKPKDTMFGGRKGRDKRLEGRSM